MSLNSAPQGDAPGIGERLRVARESRGLSLEAVTADLRIRTVILAAMEREDHAALPERVYLLGLLKTYATFLGLDPAAVAAGWARGPEGAEGGAPGTWTAERPTVTVQNSLRQSLRGLLSLGFVGLSVLLIAGFLLIQLIRFASPPSLTVTSPLGDVISLSSSTRVAVLRGTATAGTQILIQNAVGDSVTAQADASGIWTVEVPLSGGRNEVDISAVDPATGSASGALTRRVFIVALPLSDAPQLDVVSPTSGLRVSGGAVPIALATEPEGEVIATATSRKGEVITGTFTAQSDGKLQGDLLLPAGSWSIDLKATGPNGTVSEVHRDVEVVFSGVTITVTAIDVGTWIRVWADGVIDPLIGPNGLTLRKGETRTLRATSAIDVRFGNPRGALVALNGRMLGERGVAGIPESWSFRSDGRVFSSIRK